MPLTAGTNCFTQAADAVRLMLASSPKVRTFLGAADEAAAQARIYSHEVPRTAIADQDDWDAADYVAQFPCAIVSPPSDGRWFVMKAIARDNTIQYEVDFTFIVRLEAFADPAKDEQEQLRSFENVALDGIEEMLADQTGEPGIFTPTEVTILELYRADFRKRQDLGHLLGVVIQFERSTA